jgi:gliding motility-associated-like protein
MLSFISSTKKLNKYAVLAVIFGLFTQISGFAQCLPLVNAVPNISYTYIQAGGTNASGVAYNPLASLYYCGIAGNITFPLETFDACGNALYQTNTGFDLRGLWWNPALNQTEGNGYNTTGVWTWNLDPSNYALNTGAPIFVGNNQPNAQSCGDLDYDANEIIYYDGGSIYRYDRATNAFLGNYAITGLPVAPGNLNSYGVVYTGCPGYEIGVLDYILKKFYFVNKATGAYSGESQFPAAAITNSSFRFSYANDLAWLYDVGSRTWFSYQVLSGSAPNVTVGSFLPADTTLCAGQTLNLDVTQGGATGYLWQDATVSPLYTISAAGTYYVDISGPCPMTDTIVVTYAAASLLDLGNDTILCTGATLTLDATSLGSTYLWQDLSTSPTLLVNAAGTYYVDVDNGGCSGTDTIVVTYFDVNGINIGNDTTICNGATLALDATFAGGTYVWQDLSTNATFTATGAGTYYVDVTVSGCLGTDSIIVLTAPVPTVALGNDTALCPAATLLLDAGNVGMTYLWQDNSTNQTFTATAAGTYYVEVTNSGCTRTDTIVVTVTNLPPPNAGLDVSYCEGDLILDLIATGASGGALTWYADLGLTIVIGTGPNLTPATLPSVITYYVTETLGVCESAADAVTVTITALPLAPVVSPDTAYCAGDFIGALTGTASAGGTINWYDDAGLANLVGTGATYTPPATLGAVTYYVTETVNGCLGASAAVTVTVNPIPAPPQAGLTATYCTGDPIAALVAVPNAGGTINWYIGATLANNVGTGSTYTPVSIVGSTDYYVTETVLGCESLPVVVSVTIIDPPSANVFGNSSICIGQSTILTAEGNGDSFIWNTGAAAGTITIAPGVDTWYYVTYTNGCGTAVDSVRVIVNPRPIADAGLDTIVGIGNSYELVPYGGVSYIWSPGTWLTCTECENPITTPLLDTFYVVLVIDENGCTATDTVFIEVDPNIHIYIPNIFSPNGDGINDELFVRGNGIVSIQFLIFDRWGALVFETTDQEIGWDGKHRGKKVNSGAFAYVLHANMIDGESRIVKGNVTIVR